ncbi:hypothetical protein WOLCODRAFT_162365 [Wolfiporia cocos MD-104 SS10]|uniref:Uncharacterized protein n=1 Tax=Wolfiporia cocos (strain MD-104) TaxID=742152 RepID=A0A2H3JDX6_WOLCO|nr:hypothetical protein WOLCODRAFT_162365 [Wolfiporia cocos MD-104 SS10]
MSRPDESALVAFASAMAHACPPPASPHARHVHRRLADELHLAAPAITVVLSERVQQKEIIPDKMRAAAIKIQSTPTPVPSPAPSPPTSPLPAAIVRRIAIISRNSPITIAEWRTRLLPIVAQMPSNRALRNASYRISTAPDNPVRLVQRFSSVCWINSSGNGHTWFHHHLQLLHFATEWSRLANDDKAKFYYTAYAAQDRVHADELSHGDIIYNCHGRWLTDYSTWRRMAETVVAAGTRIFGAAVLLDPYWNVAHLAPERCDALSRRVYRDVAAVWATAMRARRGGAIQVTNAKLCRLLHVDDPHTSSTL